jgi:excisionase family DNA binding protein
VKSPSPETASERSEEGQVGFLADTLLTTAPPPSRVRVLDGGIEKLLTVAQVAKRLQVSHATVYALCERGELLHMRVSNSIRVAPGDLEGFIRARKGE